LTPEVGGVVEAYETVGFTGAAGVFGDEHAGDTVEGARDSEFGAVGGAVFRMDCSFLAGRINAEGGMLAEADI